MPTSWRRRRTGRSSCTVCRPTPARRVTRACSTAVPCPRVPPESPLGPVTLQTFGLMFALAFLAAGALVAKRFAELDRPTDWAYEMIFSALAGGIIGSRLYYIVENYDKVKDDL